MITYTRTPLKFTPSYNPIGFSLSGSTPETVLYKVELIESNSGTVIYTGNIYPKPLSPSIGNINLSNQLSSVVKPDVDNDLSLILEKRDPIIAYKLRSFEYGVSGGTLTQLSTGNTSETFYSFDAQLDGFNFTNRFIGNTYVMQSGYTGKFLTLQPDNKIVNDYSTEQLYFLQSGYTGLTMNIFNDLGAIWEESITGSTPVLITSGSPEIRSQAQITITGTCAAGDNLTVKVNGATLGSYTASTVSLPTTALATYLNNSMVSNTSGYTISVSGSTITIKAPVGLGSLGNSLSLTTSTVTATTVNVITGETLATVILGSYERIPTTYEIVRVQVEDPIYGTYYIWDGPVDFSLYTPDVDGFTECLVDLINSNTPDNLGYSAIKTDYNQFRLTARTGTGDLLNATEAWIIFEDIPEAYDGIWSGGVTLGYSGMTTYHSPIPHSKTSFAGGVNGVSDVSGSTLSNMIRLQVSPKKIIENGITGINPNEKYYINVSDLSGNTISETKTYIYQDIECNLEYVNILWTNSIGGVDSYQFINPQESISVEKVKINKNNLNIDSSTPYLTNDVYNVIEDTYGSTTKSSFKVYTKVLSDDESNWLTELVKSKNIYVELSDTKLVPVQLVNTNYDQKRTKYNRTELNQYQFEFSIGSEFLPAMSYTGIIING